MNIVNNQQPECTGCSVKCPICGGIYVLISRTHLKHKHNMTNEEFAEQYPRYKMFLDGNRFIVGKRRKGA
jgi:hypothetical protein